MLTLLTLVSIFAGFINGDVSQYANWQPDTNGGYTYCESTGSVNNYTIRGVACGNSSYRKQVSMVSDLDIFGDYPTLGLLSVGWLNSRVLTTQKGWFEACRPYLVQLWDNLWYSQMVNYCPFTYPTIPAVAADCSIGNNMITRKGNGYCMSQPVCGATIPIYFVRSNAPDDTGSINTMWFWDNTTITFQASIAYVAYTCYGFSLVQETDPRNATILSAW